MFRKFLRFIESVGIHCICSFYWTAIKCQALGKKQGLKRTVVFSIELDAVGTLLANLKGFVGFH